MYLRNLKPDTRLSLSAHAFKHYRHDFGSFWNRSTPHRQLEDTRSYLRGDPLTAIDWKAYARSDQLLIKQKRHSARASVAIAVSAAPSMHWQASDQQLSKFALAMRIALHLAFTHSKRLDSVSLVLRQCPQQTSKPLQASSALALFRHLEQRGYTLAACQQVCDEPAKLPTQADIKYWLGDALDTDAPTAAEFLAASSIGSFLHTLSPNELRSEWLVADCNYYAGAREVSGKELRLVMEQEVQRWLQRVKNFWQDHPAHYMLLTEETRIVEYLRYFKLC
ncbi:MAG: DUF58 domain-containing protein [Pseudomonadota bacterium]|nr:DUF58 domain-containing protein [Pseudomonadota bacterium]